MLSVAAVAYVKRGGWLRLAVLRLRQCRLHRLRLTVAGDLDFEHIARFRSLYMSPDVGERRDLVAIERGDHITLTDTGVTRRRVGRYRTDEHAVAPVFDRRLR